MALLSFPYGMEGRRLLSSTLCAPWTLLRVLEQLSITSKPRLCGGGGGEEALKICDFLAFQCPTSSSALTSFFTCRERITTLSMNLGILLMCQRSVNLTPWWIYCWIAMMYSQSLDGWGLCAHWATLTSHHLLCLRKSWYVRKTRYSL